MVHLIPYSGPNRFLNILRYKGLIPTYCELPEAPEEIAEAVPKILFKNYIQKRFKLCEMILNLLIIFIALLSVSYVLPVAEATIVDQKYKNIKPLPGPFNIPFIGSPPLILAQLTGNVVKELLHESEKFGPVFGVKTGPITQIWVSDINTAMRLYQKEECSGRSQLKEPVFGDEFLFLMRNPREAAIIRSRQKGLIAERATKEATFSAVKKAHLDSIIAGLYIFCGVVANFLL